MKDSPFGGPAGPRGHDMDRHAFSDLSIQPLRRTIGDTTFLFQICQECFVLLEAVRE
jgi:hypothetical protein